MQSLADAASGGGPHPSIPQLALLVFEAVLEVVCVSLPGYIIAALGMFDADAQKFVAGLNVMLFTPCLIFTKLASQLSAGKLADLAVIPVLFCLQTLVSYLSAWLVARCFAFRRRQANFVTAMGVFGNSNSLPISLVLSLSKTLSGLHWDKLPHDNDNEVAARGILYLLIFQQLGQAVRWSWGYHVLLAPRESYLPDEEAADRYRDEPEPYTDTDGQTGIDGHDRQTGIDEHDRQTGIDEHDRTAVNSGRATPTYSDDTHFGSGSHTPVPYLKYPDRPPAAAALALPADDASHQPSERTLWSAVRARLARLASSLRALAARLFAALPQPLQRALSFISARLARFLSALWAFMNPPLWAMLVAIVVASIPALQRTLFTPGNFLSNSVTRAVKQSGGVAVPLILVVLGANLERSTLPAPAEDEPDDPKEERNLIVASLLARMVLPTLVMGPILALAAKYVPVSILSDPIFVVVCFLLVGAPSALQLAQICQINNVYMGAMSRILFHSYVVWILPSTLILVISALQVVQWAAN